MIGRKVLVGCKKGRHSQGRKQRLRRACLRRQPYETRPTIREWPSELGRGRCQYTEALQLEENLAYMSRIVRRSRSLADMLIFTSTMKKKFTCEVLVQCSTKSQSTSIRHEKLHNDGPRSSTVQPRPGTTWQVLRI